MSARLLTGAQLAGLRAAGEVVPEAFSQRVAHSLMPDALADGIEKLLELRALLDAYEAALPADRAHTVTPSSRAAWLVAHETQHAPGGAAARLLADGAPASAGCSTEGQYANLVKFIVSEDMTPTFARSLTAHARRLRAEAAGALPPGAACRDTMHEMAAAAASQPRR